MPLLHELPQPPRGGHDRLHDPITHSLYCLTICIACIKTVAGHASAAAGHMQALLCTALAAAALLLCIAAVNDKVG